MSAYEVLRPDHARRLHWSWRCLSEGCGWVGIDLPSEAAAEREAARHATEPHCACGVRLHRYRALTQCSDCEDASADSGESR